MGKFRQVLDFASFLLGSTNQHGIHSPYLFQFYQQVISEDKNFYAFQKLETIRHSYFRNQNMLPIIELGAGSSFSQESHKSISTIAKQQLSGPYQLQVIFRTVNWLQNQLAKDSLEIVELGASLGLSTFYLASTSRNNQVFSFEGNEHFIQFIEYQKSQLSVHNIEMIEGNFDTTFKKFARSRNSVDFAFIDGNHREEATYQYFEWSLQCINPKGIMIFDDIHWSKGMHDAWKKITQHPRVRASIDMYFMGIVFLDPDFQEKRNLKIRPRRIR